MRDVGAPSQFHADFPRLSEPAKSHWLKLAFIAQAVAMATREKCATAFGRVLPPAARIAYRSSDKQCKQTIAGNHRNLRPSARSAPAD